MSTPSASVIVPTRARVECLERCLGSLTGLAGENFEVIVVDDGSPEPVEGVTFAAPMNIRYFRQERAGPAAARNRGAAAARAPILAFIDDDCLAEPSWLSILTTTIRDRPDALVGGTTYNALPDNIFSQASQDIVSFMYDYQSRYDPEGIEFFASNNLACSRERFVQLGGFDKTFSLAAAEDRDLGLRWKSAGWPLVHAPRAVVRHQHWLDLVSFWRQHSNYGRGWCHLRDQVAAREEKPLRLQGLRFYLLMASYAMNKAPRWPVIEVCLLALAQLATVSGYCEESFRKALSKAAVTAG